MGKRELKKKVRLPRDYYSTVDIDAAIALKPFLYSPDGPTRANPEGIASRQPENRLVRYIEPCAGGGHLMDLLHAVAAPVVPVAAYDIDPQRSDITQRSCLTLGPNECKQADCFITNPPFAWQMLEPILLHLPLLLPTWLLLPSDVMFNKRMSVHMQKCSDAVAVGRLWWFLDDKGKKIKGVDNYVWLKFDSKYEGSTRFHPRVL